MEFLKVSNTDIERLTDLQLTELLSILLYFEAEKSGITANSVGVLKYSLFICYEKVNC